MLWKIDQGMVSNIMHERDSLGSVEREHSSENRSVGNNVGSDMEMGESSASDVPVQIAVSSQPSHAESENSVSSPLLEHSGQAIGVQATSTGHVINSDIQRDDFCSVSSPGDSDSTSHVSPPAAMGGRASSSYYSRSNAIC
ncbi:hypothetical protein V6N12_064046 [Hibiscus sabdariffa]|uniref:Uncharacterized protein n=1 Tax=Hibiscus sabdariffa TaxID=183260 RepID=A0ABR2AXK3_9ROSI